MFLYISYKIWKNLIVIFLVTLLFPGYFLKKMSNPLCRIKVYLIRTFYDNVLDSFSDWVIPGVCDCITLHRHYCSCHEFVIWEEIEEKYEF